MPRTGTCIYCGERPGLTNDHIPPKCFFEKKCPMDAQRVTVRCCESCRTKDEKIDAFVRNIIAGLSETEITPYVRAHILDRVTRSVEQLRWESHRLMEVMTWKRATIASARWLANVSLPAIKIDIPEMDRFFERIARGVLYDAFHKGFFAGRIRWLPFDNSPDPMKSFFQQQGIKRSILDVFEYQVSPPFGTGTYLALATFYRVKTFLIQVEEIQAQSTVSPIESDVDNA